MINIEAVASGSKGNFYILESNSGKLLIECGIKIKKIKKTLDFNLASVDGALLSHFHGDHSKSVKKITSFGVDVYTSPETIEALGISNHRLNPVKQLEQFNLGSWTILPFPTKHDVAGSLGFLVINEIGERLLFATDTYYLKYRFKDLNVIMIECNYAKDILDKNVRSGRVPASRKKRVIQSHFSLENVKDFLRANDLSQLQEIHLLHLSNDNSDAERFKREIQQLAGIPVYIAE